MKKKIMNSLLHIGAGIMLSVFIYKCGEAADSPASEMTEAEKSVLSGRSGDDEVAGVCVEPEESTRTVPEQGVLEEIPYYFACQQTDYSMEYINSGLSDDRNGMKIMQIEIPEDREREKRINRMLVREALDRLPGGGEEDWWRMTKMDLDYRSNRYLCWHYIPHTSLPDDWEWEDMYFTLDLKEEKLVDYPGKVLDGGVGGVLYKEMESGWEKTVEEQDALQREKGYALHEVRSDCDGTFFPAVAGTGLEDDIVQERINGHLQEGMKACIENKGWEDYRERRQSLFDKTKIFISYKSDRWLSVVYSIQMDRPWKGDDEICDIPVVIDMWTGERVMADDLVDFDGLQNWIACTHGWMVREKEIERLNGLIRTERENLEDMFYTGNFAMQCYQNEWCGFYLYRGKLVLLAEGSFFDIEISLPELYGYLKVDPWYD